MALWCNPISGHQTLYWYQQTPGQGLGLLVHFENEDAVDDSRLPKNRFSAERPKRADSTLMIHRAELGDSAVYFCASSLATASQRHFLLVHKASGFSSLDPTHRSSEQRLYHVHYACGRSRSAETNYDLYERRPWIISWNIRAQNERLKIMMTQEFEALFGDNSRMQNWKWHGSWTQPSWTSDGLLSYKNRQSPTMYNKL